MTTNNRSINLKTLRDSLELQEAQARVEQAWAKKDQEIKKEPVCGGCIWHRLYSDCPYERIDPETDIQSGPEDDCPACDGYTSIEDYCKWLEGTRNK